MIVRISQNSASVESSFMCSGFGSIIIRNDRVSSPIVERLKLSRLDAHSWAIVRNPHVINMGRGMDNQRIDPNYLCCGIFYSYCIEIQNRMCLLLVVMDRIWGYLCDRICIGIRHGDEPRHRPALGTSAFRRGREDRVPYAC